MDHPLLVRAASAFELKSVFPLKCDLHFGLLLRDKFGRQIHSSIVVEILLVVEIYFDINSSIVDRTDYLKRNLSLKCIASEFELFSWGETKNKDDGRNYACYSIIYEPTINKPIKLRNRF